MPAKLEITQGTRFNQLIVISETSPKHKNRRFLCRCDCGNEVTVYLDRLRHSLTQSCGCYQRQRARESQTAHGMRRSSSYNSWSGMVARCKNPNHPAFDSYGERGIKVCDRWLKFENFYADMGEKPDNHSLDRIDNNGSYCPENCKWSTVKEQNNNKRSNRLLTADGMTLNLAQWEVKQGLTKGALSNRLNRGWTLERVISTLSRESGDLKK